MQSLNKKTLTQQLDSILDVEFTFIDTKSLAADLLPLPASQQSFLLDWAQRVASTNVELARQFLRLAIIRIGSMDLEVIEAWALEAMNEYDRLGLHPALKVINKVDEFLQYQRDKGVAAQLEDNATILQHFAHGLSGRRLQIQESDACFTDTESIFLPLRLVQLPSCKDNFLLYKSMVAYLWSQTRFGTFRQSLTEISNKNPQTKEFLSLFHCFETLRLEGCIQRSLPGLYRDMCRLKALVGQQQLLPEWERHRITLFKPNASIQQAIQMTQDNLGQLACFKPFPYQGELRLELVDACREKRISREKAEVRTALYKLQQ
ncbi:MAG: nitric oxide reductase activation protein, partial [Thiohalomonadales bacterium]